MFEFLFEFHLLARAAADGTVLSAASQRRLMELRTLLKGHAGPRGHRRRWARFPMAARARLRGGEQWPEAIEVLDASAGGFLVTARRERPSGLDVVLEVETRSGAALVFPCRVAWHGVLESRPCAGLQLSALPRRGVRPPPPPARRRTPA